VCVLYVKLSRFTFCISLLISEVCFDIGDVFVFTLVFIGEDGGVFIFLGESNNAFALFGDGNLSLSDLFNIFFVFDFFVTVGLISAALPSGLVRIISRRSSSDICLIPKLLA